jgi:uncharacterized protein (TIGR03435 family)
MARRFAALGLAIITIVVATAGLHGQAVAPPQAPAVAGFEVASVRRSNPNPATPAAGAPMMLPALGRLTAQNVTLRLLVIGAYQKQPFELVGGPAWQNSDKFDIQAKAEDASISTDGMLKMLQVLLADRFKLKVHTETRDVPIYNLIVARSDGKLGSLMKPSTDTCPDFKETQQKMLEALARGGAAAVQSLMGRPGENRPCSITQVPPSPTNPSSFTMQARGQSIELLALLLRQFVGRPVIDKTGLTGAYDYDLTIDLQTLFGLYRELGINVPAPPNLPEGPSLMTTLQENLGLKLDAGRGAGEVLVIDSAELPVAD